MPVPRLITRHRSLTTVALSALLLLVACAPSPTQVTADCSNQLRLDGVVYTEAGFTDEVGSEAGEVDLSDCADVGENPRGSNFPDAPRVAIANEVEGFDPGEVLGIDEGDFVRVYLSDSIPLKREATLRAQIGTLGP